MGFVVGDLQLKTQRVQMVFHAALELLAVLQSARRVKSHHALGLGFLWRNTFFQRR
jgi:hypothetical protein